MTIRPVSQMILDHLNSESITQSDPTLPWYGTHNFMPDTPDNVITVYDTTPVLQGRSPRNPTDMRRRYGIQIAIRCRDNFTAWQKAGGIESLLLAMNYILVLSFPVGVLARTTISLSTGLVKYGEEEKNRRKLFSMNFLVTIWGA